jgi:hypothetical protein
VEPPVSLLSPRLNQYPVVYVTSAADTAFELSREQVHRFGEYLRQGGFAIVDNGAPWYDFSPAEASLLNLLLDALGEDARFEPIEADHRLLHCFYDFRGPLPVGARDRAVPVRKNLYETYERVDTVSSLQLDTESLASGGPFLVQKTVTRAFSKTPTALPTNIWGRLLNKPGIQALHSRIRAFPNSLWGVWIGDRLAAVYSDRGYGHLWQEGIRGYVRWYNRPADELGINMLVYGLTQPGGIAQLHMNWMKEARAYSTIKIAEEVEMPKMKDLVDIRAILKGTLNPETLSRTPLHH